MVEFLISKIMATTIDPRAINIAKAIRQHESGGDYAIPGKSGEFGAYQFTEPTWNAYSKKYGINVPLQQANRLQQNEVAVRQINDWITSGKAKNVGEIASMWNAGEGRPQAYLEDNVGMNKYGVKFNTPEYAKKVAGYYQQIKQGDVSQETLPKKGGGFGGFVKSLVSAPATIVARPFQAIAALGGVSQETLDKFSKEKLGGFVAPVPKSGSDVVKDIGRGFETAAWGVGAGGAVKAGTTFAKQGLKETIKKTAIEGVKAGTVFGASQPLIEKGSDATAGDVLKSGAVGGLFGLGAGVVTPLAFRAGSKIINRFTPSSLTDRLDDSIRNIFKGTTGDIQKINDSAFRARKGLELLQKESSKIKIPDMKAPLGSNIKKTFNLQKSTPNELLSGVLEMDRKIASNARTAVEKAKEKGIKIDTTDIETKIFSEIENGKVQKATGKQMIKQIQSAKNDPVALHDWVQDVNIKYGKKYQRGTIDDTATGKLADDVAEVLRTKLNSVVDRRGYAEAYANNQELKRMLVVIAKKANKGINFGDIATDAGLDLGISILTGNPAYMARTVGTGLFRGILSKMRNIAGFRSFKKASVLSSKLPTETRLPSSRVKTSALKASTTQVAENLASKQESIQKNILDKIESANYNDLAGYHLKSASALHDALTLAKENNIKFPIDKVSKRTLDLYKGIKFYENKIQTPTPAQTTIKNTTSRFGKNNKEIPSIIKTDQKLVLADISPTIPKKSNFGKSSKK